MPVDFQTGFNLAVGLSGALLGWVLNTIWSAVKDMQRADHDLTERVNEIEVLVAGEYLKRSEYRSDMVTVFAKLDAIIAALNGKVDK